MLKRPVPSSSRRLAGLLLSLAAVSAGGTLAWAAQPATPPSPAPSVPAVAPGKVGPAMEVTNDGGAPRTLSKAGQPGAAEDAAAALAPPPYPPAALANGEGGTVMLALRVGADGRVLEARYEADGSTLAESSSLVQAARDAALKWQLEPAREDGRPVEGWVQVPVTFEPDKG